MANRTALLALSGALMAASTASGQVTGVLVSRTIGYSQAAPVGAAGSGGYNLLGANSLDVDNTATQIFADMNSYPSYNNYQLSTDINNAAGYISFANNVTSAGIRSYMQAQTIITVNYTNPTAQAINPTLTSTIIPGGFGLYTGNLRGNPTITNAASNQYTVPIVRNLNATPLNANGSFNTSGLYYDAYFQDSASFSFQILSGSTVIASYSADLTMNHTQDPVTGEHNWSPVLTTNFSTPLNGFGAFPGDNPNQAVDYAWDTTPVTLDLGLVAAGANASLTYITTVTTQTYEGSYIFPGETIVAYAGFGDPIGKASGAQGIADPAFPLLQLGLPDFQIDPNTGAAAVSAATFNNVYAPTQLPITQVIYGAAIPEPGLWALWTVGCGLLGARLRNRVASRRRSRPMHAVVSV